LFRLIEEGGDWDRRNRLKVYQGLHALMMRDFKTAAKQFLDSLPQVKNFLFSLYECRYADFFKSLGKSISFNLKKNEISKLNTLFISLC